MTDSVTPPAPEASAGALLRAAREKQGLHIAALAASIKVPVAKLEALEADQYSLLPDAAFTRALAHAVCRALKTDPQPVLARLPLTDTSSLDHVVGNLNAPFRERSGPDLPSVNLGAVRPMAWAGGVLLVAAAVVYFLPGDVWQQRPAAEEPAQAVAPAASEAAASEPAAVAEATPAAPALVAAAPASAVAAQPMVETVHDAPAIEQAASVGAPATLVQLRADEPSWVEVFDGKGQVLFSRLLLAGETVGVDGQTPIRLKIGNAPATRLSFRGKPVDLTPLTRNAVARVELQ
ncbi:XRE family transcriptional regulator [Rubrivivax gelatinosus]|uniref:XRE family transcriptional regulator n=1 Tax=Rubrivivax gelatinosus TaxID=28068 RepID=A0ABS1DRB2_RUBGE|nr:helix-turn-helix domain-containing protein [Rubrivivax gelatinosus]MBK1613938.1 XRE family transcriptional regulator [Rubrivivax gelatinosus]MBK1712539.1 XRE family transcriptional regulator [Rubrivivax gelatinosus]